MACRGFAWFAAGVAFVRVACRYNRSDYREQWRGSYFSGVEAVPAAYGLPYPRGDRWACGICAAVLLLARRFHHPLDNSFPFRQLDMSGPIPSQTPGSRPHHGCEGDVPPGAQVSSARTLHDALRACCKRHKLYFSRLSGPYFRSRYDRYLQCGFHSD